MSIARRAAFGSFRAGWIMVREGVVAALAGRPALRPAEARLAHRAAVHQAPGAAPRPQRPACRARSRGSGPPMSSSASSWRRGPTSSATTSRSISRMLQDRMETFPKAEAVAAIEGSLGRPVGELLREPRRTGRRRLDRPGARRRGRPRRRDRQGRREGDPARRAPRFPARPRKLFPRRAAAGALHPRRRAACARSRSPRRSPRPPRSRWICGSRRRRFPSSARTQGRSRLPRARRSTGSAPAATC